MHIEDYLPQRPPLLIIDRVLSHSEKNLVCEVDWQRLSFFCDAEGQLLRSAMVEMVAQAAAVMNGLANPQAPRQLGFLTMVKKFRFYSLPKQRQSLTIELKIETTIGLHRIVHGKVMQQREILAEGQVFTACVE